MLFEKTSLYHGILAELAGKDAPKPAEKPKPYKLGTMKFMHKRDPFYDKRASHVAKKIRSKADILGFEPCMRVLAFREKNSRAIHTLHVPERRSKLEETVSTAKRNLGGRRPKKDNRNRRWSFNFSGSHPSP